MHITHYNFYFENRTSNTDLVTATMYKAEHVNASLHLQQVLRQINLSVIFAAHNIQHIVT